MTNGLARLEVERARARRSTQVKLVFAILGLLVGAVGAVHAYTATSSWFAAVYAFLMAQWLVGRGCGRTLTKPQKVRRFLRYLIPASTTLGALFLAQRLWESWWLSVVLGVVAGGLIGGGGVVFMRPVPRRKMVDPGRFGR